MTLFFILVVLFILLVIGFLCFWYKKAQESYGRVSDKKESPSPTILLVSSHLDLPKCHPIGFEVMDVPDALFQSILEQYHRWKHTITKEIDPSAQMHIHNVHGNVASQLINIHQQPGMTDLILDRLRPLHEIWSGAPLVNASCFGIRSYSDGSVLKAHVDRFQTHHISSIIIVDKKVKTDWPLDIKDHSGQWHQIYANVGQMILYESAVCEHARKIPFEGEYFRNLFVHYKFKNIKIKS